MHLPSYVRSAGVFGPRSHIATLLVVGVMLFKKAYTVVSDRDKIWQECSSSRPKYAYWRSQIFFL